ncbi:MAG: ROK family protein [Betaproteobacteria bacterium]|nr:ROK family protein [Betaproteobacteria bacterium]
MGVRVGIDLGGTKIEAIALDPSGREVFRKRVASPRDVYEDTVNAIVALALEAEQAAGTPASVGVGIPGSLSRATGLVKNANSTWLNGRPLKQDLEARLGREVRIENDANCFAVSEAVDGAGAGAEIVFGVILGTGVGGGIAIRGEAITGINAIAGEWGHNALPLPQAEDLPLRPCYCGRAGCIETYLSGPAMQRDANLELYCRRLARSLAMVINILDPDVIVLGGGVSNVDALYEAVPKLWLGHVFSDRVATRLVRAKYGDSSGVRGAAWLWGRGG